MNKSKNVPPASNIHRTVASTKIVANKKMGVDELNTLVAKAVKDLKLSTPSTTSTCEIVLSINGMLTAELVNVASNQAGLDKEQSETVDEYIDRKLVDETATLQKVIAAAIDNGNEAAQVAQESKITHEKLEELLSASPDPQVSLNALLRSRGPQRELDLGSRFAYVGGYKKFSTCFESARKFQFNSCTVVSRGQGSKFKLLYGSWKDVGNGKNHSEAGRIDVVVEPETVEEKLLEFSISSNAIIDALVTPLRDLSASREFLLLAEILNPHDVARAANKTLEEILNEIHSRSAQPR